MSPRARPALALTASLLALSALSALDARADAADVPSPPVDAPVDAAVDAPADPPSEAPLEAPADPALDGEGEVLAAVHVEVPVEEAAPSLDEEASKALPVEHFGGY